MTHPRHTTVYCRHISPDRQTDGFKEQYCEIRKAPEDKTIIVTPSGLNVAVEGSELKGAFIHRYQMSVLCLWCGSIGTDQLQVTERSNRERLW